MEPRPSIKLNLQVLRSIAVALLSCDAPGQSASQAGGEWYHVIKVSDGDTFHAKDKLGNVIKVRLIGIDAPESRKTSKKDVQYYGKEAKVFLTNLILGKNVRLEFDVGKKDRYGRTLAYVYLEDGTFINAELVKQGYAVIMTVPPNVKYADLFLKLQQEAREAKRGLWGD